jgi:uncharacterized protein (DUF1697 family)
LRQHSGSGDITMTTYIALLRAVNVGGTGKLPMKDLVAICESAGLRRVRTYIASGNVIFDSRASERTIKQLLQEQLQAYAGKPIGVLVRTAAEICAVLTANPFPAAAPNRTVAIFLDARPPRDSVQRATGRADEQIQLGKREIYVHYGSAMGASRLKFAAAANGTARNMNTVARLAAMALAAP